MRNLILIAACAATLDCGGATTSTGSGAFVVDLGDAGNPDGGCTATLSGAVQGTVPCSIDGGTGDDFAGIKLSFSSSPVSADLALTVTQGSIQAGETIDDATALPYLYVASAHVTGPSTLAWEQQYGNTKGIDIIGTFSATFTSLNPIPKAGTGATYEDLHGTYRASLHELADGGVKPAGSTIDLSIKF